MRKTAVIPAKAGIQTHTPNPHTVSAVFWIPAFAGMTAIHCFWVHYTTYYIFTSIKYTTKVRQKSQKEVKICVLFSSFKQKHAIQHFLHQIGRRIKIVIGGLEAYP